MLPAIRWLFRGDSSRADHPWPTCGPGRLLAPW